MHLVKGSMQDFRFMANTAAVLNFGGFDKGTGEIGGMAKESGRLKIASGSYSGLHH